MGFQSCKFYENETLYFAVTKATVEVEGVASVETGVGSAGEWAVATEVQVEEAA